MQKSNTAPSLLTEINALHCSKCLSYMMDTCVSHRFSKECLWQTPVLITCSRAVREVIIQCLNIRNTNSGVI